jgi:hypothetical protein
MHHADAVMVLGSYSVVRQQMAVQVPPGNWCQHLTLTSHRLPVAQKLCGIIVLFEENSIYFDCSIRKHTQGGIQMEKAVMGKLASHLPVVLFYNRYSNNHVAIAHHTTAPTLTISLMNYVLWYTNLNTSRKRKKRQSGNQINSAELIRLLLMLAGCIFANFVGTWVYLSVRLFDVYTCMPVLFIVA